MEQATSNKVVLIKNIYFYLVSFVALMMMVFSSAELINNLLKMYVFTKADNYSYSTCPTMTYDGNGKPSPVPAEECAKQDAINKKMADENRVSNLQRSIVNAISFFAIGLPLFILHWRVVRRKEE